MKVQLHVDLLSDATFGRGDGITGFVDQEIEYEAETGLPFIRGRTIKGLLVEECANIFFALPDNQRELFNDAAHYLFGSPGSNQESQAGMHVGAARMPADLRQAILYAVREEKSLQPAEVLATLTELRRQTAVNHTSGVPDEGSLRTMRVLRRGVKLQATITFDKFLIETAPELALLSACVAAWRRGGVSRNRGRGRLKAYLNSAEQQAAYLAQFKKISGGGDT